MEGVLTVRNKESSPIDVWLEPLGNVRTLNPDSTVRIPFNGPDGGLIEVEYKIGQVVIWGFSGSVMEFEAGPNKL